MKEDWVVRPFGEVCEVIGGSQPPKSTFIYEPKDDYIRLVQVRDYRTNKFKTYIPLDRAKKFCSKTDIMIGRYGPPIFGIFQGIEGAYNVALMKAVPNEKILYKEFFYWFLKTDKLVRFVEKSSKRAAGQDGVRKDLLYKYLVPIPALEEQKQIVAILDKAFEAMDRAKENIEKNLANAKELFQSKLDEIFSQKGEGWEEKELGDICHTTNNIKWNNFEKKELHYIDLSSVSRDTLKITQTIEINSINAPSRAKKIVNTKDVIFATTRPTLKRVTLIPNYLNNQVCSTGFIVLRSKIDIILPEMIYYFIQTKKFMDKMELIQRGASYPAVSDKDVKITMINFPKSIDTQLIVNKNLKSIYDTSKNLEKIYQQKLSNLEDLKKSILQKAFNGELV